MKLIFILLYCLAFPSSGRAVPDSLETDYVYSIMSSEPDRALRLADMMDGGSEDGTFSTNRIRAYASAAKGNYSLSIAYARKALASETAQGDAEIYRMTCEWLIDMSIHLGRYADAMKFCRVARCKLAGDPRERIHIRYIDGAEARICRRFGDKAAADSLMRLCIDAFKKTPNPSGLSFPNPEYDVVTTRRILDNQSAMVSWAILDGDCEKAEKYNSALVAEIEDMKASGRVGMERGQIAESEWETYYADALLAGAEIAILSGRKLEAQSLMARAGRLDTRAVPEVLLHRARCLYLSEQYDNAEALIRRLLESTSGEPVSEVRRGAYIILSGVYSLKKDYKDALDAYAMSYAVSDSLQRKWKNDNAMDIRAFYRDREVRAELQAQKDMLETRNVYLAFCTVLIILLALAVAIAYRNLRMVSEKNASMAKLIDEYAKSTVESVSEVNDFPESENGESLRDDYAAVIRKIREDKLYLSHDLSRDQLVALTGINKNRMASLFQQCVGMTLPNYINSLRLEHSLKLLADGKLTIEAVAFDSGFNNARTFYRIFRDTYGMTPAEYRNAAMRESRN